MRSAKKKAPTKKSPGKAKSKTMAKAEGISSKSVTTDSLKLRSEQLGIKLHAEPRALVASIKKFRESREPLEVAPPPAILRNLPALAPQVKRFHGVKVPVTYFPDRLVH